MFQAQLLHIAEVAGCSRSSGAAYRLCKERLACGSDTSREAQEKLTSDELEGLRYELIAVLVVRHDCGGLSGV